jgi:hypothetical protein
MTIPKYHHIIPAFYLGGFSETGTKTGQLHVFNLKRNKRYHTISDNTGGQKHFFDINPKYMKDVKDPVIYEKLMSKLIEGPASEALYEMREKKSTISSDHFDKILTLVALIHARSAYARSIAEKSIQKQVLEQLQKEEVTQKQWDFYLAERKYFSKVNETIPNDVKDACLLAKKGEFFPKSMPSEAVRQAMKVSDYIYQILRKRKWSLLIAKEENGHFITSNSPLTSGEGWETHQNKDEEGLQNPKSTVVFPLDSQMAIISWCRTPWHSYLAERSLIAMINARTLNRSEGEIYWNGTDFPLLDAKSKVSSFENFYKDFTSHSEDFKVR